MILLFTCRDGALTKPLLRDLHLLSSNSLLSWSLNVPTQLKPLCFQGKGSFEAFGPPISSFVQVETFGTFQLNHYDYDYQSQFVKLKNCLFVAIISISIFMLMIITKNAIWDGCRSKRCKWMDEWMGWYPGRISIEQLKLLM